MHCFYNLSLWQNKNQTMGSIIYSSYFRYPDHNLGVLQTPFLCTI